MNFFDYSFLTNKLKWLLIILDFFKIQIVIGRLWNFHYLHVEKIHPSVPPWRDLQLRPNRLVK